MRVQNHSLIYNGENGHRFMYVKVYAFSNDLLSFVKKEATHGRLSTWTQADRRLSTMPNLSRIYTNSDCRPGHSHRRMLRSFLLCRSLLLCQLQNLLSAHRRDLIHSISGRMDLLHHWHHGMVPCTLSLAGICNPKILAGSAAHYIYPPRPRAYRKVLHYGLAAQ